MSQNQQIDAYIDKFGSITPHEAYVLCGCMRLAARAFEMRLTSILETKNKKTYARYFK